MRRVNLTGLLLRLLLLHGLTVLVIAQAPSDASYQAKRREATELFDQGKRLEALPLLEELVQTNPQDDTILVDLAASLVEHATTLADHRAAGKERFRARSLLDKAWKLGNTSPLALNLAQLLQQLPENGSIKLSDNTQVEQLMEAGEAAFALRDFDEALKSYSKALELEPGNSSAALFIANTYDKQNKFSKAAEWYQHSIELEPNVETAYRYYADMLARHGEMAKARVMLIQAAVAEPYNKIVWRELHAWAMLNNAQLNLVYVAIPELNGGEDTRSKLRYQRPVAASAAWEAYWAVKRNWQTGGQFRKHFFEEKGYRHSLGEESEALTAAAKIVEKLQRDEELAGPLTNDAAATLLLKLYHAGLIEPYILFSLGDNGIARDYAGYRTHNRRKLEEYMNQFVLPAR